MKRIVFFAIPDDANSWKKMIEHISTHKKEAIAKAEQAKQDVTQYTWRKRAEKMLELMS